MTEIEQRLNALEAEVRVLQDREIIRNIMARYGPLADAADNAERRSAAGALFADQGVYDLGENWAATGPEKIGELLNNPEHLALVENGSAHVMGMPYLIVEGETASALSYSRVYRHESGEFKVWRVSANWWQFARQGGKWQVARRTNRLLDGSADALALLHKANEET